MSKLKENAIILVANRLADMGHEIIVKAFEESDYMHNKTQNLHDSYGCCCYYKGKILDGTMRFLTGRATHGVFNYDSQEIEYGRNEIIDYFNNYKPDYSGLVLVIAVAMFYGGILESGGGRLKGKYKVISFMSNDVKDLAKKFKGRDKFIGKR